jgi:hypothetical protein
VRTATINSRSGQMSTAVPLARRDGVAQPETVARLGKSPETKPVALADASVSAAPKLAKHAGRLATVECLRVLAMLEIVRFHDHDDRLPWVGGLGLPTFLLLTNLFNCTLTERRGIGTFLRDKRERLLLPWLFWSVTYAAVLLVSAQRNGLALGGVLSWDMILAGTSSQLWFVPFALFSAGLVAAGQYLTRRLPDRATAYGAALLGAVILIGVANMPPQPLAAPIPQWLLSIPSTFFGFALGRLALAGAGTLRRHDVIGIAVPALLGAIVCGLWHPNMLVWRYSVSLLLVLAAFLIPSKSDPVSRFTSPLLFGIYLVHHLVASRLLVKVPLLEHQQYFFLVDFACTVLLVKALKATPLARFV